MAARDSVVLENHVKLFVECKIGEKVSIEFATGCVSIKPEDRRGSTTLGAFWMRVIQTYFPVHEFTYRKLYSSSIGSEALAVTIGDYTITVYLRTGLVTYEGSAVYQWFKVILKKMMLYYDSVSLAKPGHYYNDQVVMDTRKELCKTRDKVIYTDEDVMGNVVIDERKALVASDVLLTDEEVSRMSLGDSDISASPIEAQLVPSSNDFSSMIGSFALKDGESYIYPMWKQLLNKWLGLEGCKVYVCSKHIDYKRMNDIVTMAYKHRLTMDLAALYTDVISTDGQRMAHVKDSLLEGRSAEDKLFIEYRVINKLKFPTTKAISCNFIAGVYNQTVELMITSASFDCEGFEKARNLQSVTLTKMFKHEFECNFLDKLAEL